MAATGSMRRVWMGVSLTVAILALYPAWTGRTGWWYFGIAIAVFAVLLLEPWFLTWEIRRRGDTLQITDEGVLRRLARGESEYVRWSDLLDHRHISAAMHSGPGQRYVLWRSRTFIGDAEYIPANRFDPPRRSLH
jgi:hypothetical protein